MKDSAVESDSRASLRQIVHSRPKCHPWFPPSSTLPALAAPDGPRVWRRLTILYVGRLPPHPGGDAIVTVSCFTRLAARGHRVCVLAPIAPEVPGTGRSGGTRPWFRVARYPVPFWFTARETAYADRDYRAYRRAESAGLAATLPRLVEDVRPDLIVAGHELVGWHVPALARAAGVPYVLMVHGGTTLQALAGSDAAPGTRRLVADFAQAALVITVAHHLAESLRRLGLPRVRAIPNAVDLDRFRPAPPSVELRRRLGLHPDDRVVLHVSNLRAVKRPLDVVLSAALALGEEPRLAYVIVGDGPNRRAMERMAEARGIRDRFRFVGWVEHGQVAGYLNLADVVLMPSELEGLALVYLEAQACARAVVASDIPAAREVIVDGETGLLFPRGDVAGLAAATLRVTGDPVLRQAIGRRARRAAEGRGLAAAAAGYEAAFLDLAGVPRSRPAHGGATRAASRR